MVSVTMIGVFCIFLYAVTKICSFYGVGENTYGIYVLFYIFMALSVIVLPNDEPTG